MAQYWTGVNYMIASATFPTLHSRTDELINGTDKLYQIDVVENAKITNTTREGGRSKTLHQIMNEYITESWRSFSGNILRLNLVFSMNNN